MDYSSDSESSTRWEWADPWPQSLGIFDMHDLEWRPSYNAEAEPYKILDMIRDWYSKGYGLPTLVRRYECAKYECANSRTEGHEKR